jgi:hypothetical protein
MKDPILEEIYATREKLAKRFNYDIRAIAEHLRQEQEKSGRKIVRREPLRRPEAPKSAADDLPKTGSDNA